MKTSKNISIKRRLLGFFLAAVCAVQSAGAVFASDLSTESETPQVQTIHIRCAEDLISLSQNSKTDSYSRGKIFRLENDIDLSDTEFEPIAVFTGIFDGQGHAVSGFLLDESGRDFGLFRYIEEDGIVRNLTVSGEIRPEGSMERIGGIAGTNRGLIENCVFEGTLIAKKTAGGIVGCNEAQGTISGCANRGTLTITKQGGGIAGRSEGIVENCVNQGNINASALTVSEMISEQPSVTLDVSSLGTDEKKINYIGGIAGTSSGLITSCSNSGQVGYPHTGYNTGGIVGYHQGKIEGCSNSGPVFGRKNIGGIAGQFEPYAATVYEEDTAASLRSQGKDLHLMMDSLSDTIGSAADAAGTRLDSMGSAMDELSVLSDDSVNYYLDWGDDFSRDVRNGLDDLEEILDRIGADSRSVRKPIQDLRKDLDDFDWKLNQIKVGGEGTELNKAENNIQEGMKVLEKIVPIWTELMENLENLMSIILPRNDEPSENIPEENQQTVKQIQALEDYISGTLTGMEREIKEDGRLKANSAAVFRDSSLNQVDKIEAIFDRTDLTPEEREEAQKKLDAIRKNISDISDLLSTLEETTEAVDWDKLQAETKATQKEIDELRDSGSNILKDINILLKELSDSGDNMYEDSLDARQQANYLSDYVQRSLDSLRHDAGTTYEDIDRQTDDISDQLKGLKGDIRSYRTQISNQLDLISRQLEQLGDTAADSLDDMRNYMTLDVDAEKIYTDASDDESTEALRGILVNCRNDGRIETDINGGGIVGLIGVEMDLESDFSVEEIGDRSFSSNSSIRATVLNSRNFGSVTVKNNCAGGIVGRSDAGAVIRCDNYGAVTSTGGSYAGGIAGRSHYLIRNSYSLCDVTGRDYVGGVAGMGCSANNNYALVGIHSETGEKNGSIFGDIDNEGTPVLYRNYYVDEGIAAINNLTYERAAQPIRYQDMTAAEGTPREFRSFTVQFIADGRTVKRMTCRYGQSIREEDIPAVPEQNGLAGVWEDKDLSFIRRNMIIEAEYTDMLTAIASPEEVPLLFAVGSFCSETELECRELSPDSVPQWTGYQVVKAYSYSFLNREPAEAPSKLRVLSDGGRNYSILTWDEKGNTTLIQPKTDGKYLVFATSMGNFSIVKRKSMWPTAAVCGLVVILTAVVVIFKQKKKVASKVPASKGREAEEKKKEEKRIES